MRINKLLSVLALSLLYSNLFAQSGETIKSTTSIMVWITFLVIAFVVWLAIVYSEKNDVKGDFFIAPIIRFNKYFTQMAPMDKEQELLLDHDFDGIKELDNRVPPWFNFLFYGSIIFGIIYLINYHIIGSGNVQEEEYIAEVSAAESQRNILVKTGVFLNEETVTYKSDLASLNEGKDIFVKNCVSCHASDGGGLIGPNLTDDYWIHGGGIKNIFLVIKNGVPAKGMISWQTQLNPTQMQSVASYVMSLHGTTPANGKQPEGDRYIQSDSTQVKI